MMLCRAIKKRSRMTCIADGQAPGRRKERGHYGRGVGSTRTHLPELPVEQTDEFRLIQAIHKLPHERAQIGGGRSNCVSVPGDVGQQQTSDTASPAAGRVVNIAAALRLPVRLTVDPGVEAAEFNAL